MKTFHDYDGIEFTTSNKDEIQFIEDMENAGIEWRTYSGRGMYGRECPAVACDRENEQDIIRATKVKLCRDSLGMGYILYTG